MIATERLSGETSTIGMKSPFGRSLGKGGLTLMTTLKLLPLVTGRTWLPICYTDCLLAGLGDGLKF